MILDNFGLGLQLYVLRSSYRPCSTSRPCPDTPQNMQLHASFLKSMSHARRKQVAMDCWYFGTDTVGSMKAYLQSCIRLHMLNY